MSWCSIWYSSIRALLTRILFSAHCLVTVWRVRDVYDDSRFLLMLVALFLLGMETIIIIIRRKGQELKWFCPSVFFYLVCVVPAIWFLELHRITKWRTLAVNGTDIVNQTGIKEELSPIKGIGVSIPVALDADTWVHALENSMLLLLIVGRWLMPKGDITRDQLSQLLFVYIGIASDIMELFELFEEEAVLRVEVMSYAVLGVWSLSLVQFTLVLTATKARKPRVALHHNPPPPKPSAAEEAAHKCGCCNNEIWSILTMVLLQDGPFFALRLYCLIRFKLFNYNILFFTCKNALVVALQFYRLVVIMPCCRKKDAAKKEDAIEAPDDLPGAFNPTPTPPPQVNADSEPWPPVSFAKGVDNQIFIAVQ